VFGKGRRLGFELVYVVIGHGVAFSNETSMTSFFPGFNYTTMDEGRGIILFYQYVIYRSDRIRLCW